MKNKKGFTLVELLAVIAILGILATISVVAVERTLNNSKNKANEIQEELINDAARAYAADNLSTCKNGCSVSIQDLINGGYIDDKDGIENRNALVHIVKNNNNYIVSSPDSNGNYIFNFSYTGNIQTFIVPETGTYEIEVAGAEGTRGNEYSYTSSTTPVPGKGANLKAQFSLTKGDVITLVVGGQGSVTQATAQNGTSGAGGGGTFIFKTLSSISNSNYQFTKNSTNYEVLMVAAGGGGTGDSSYFNSAYNGYDGVGNTWYSPSNIIAYSKTTTAGTTNNKSTSLSSALGISQFISYDSAGGYYTINNGVCRGGFGGGGCASNYRSYGGGWFGSSYKTYSFSSGDNTTGKTGAQTGNGYAKITKQ